MTLSFDESPQTILLVDASRGLGEAMALMAPGRIRMELGGAKAPFSMDETIPDVVDMLLARQGKPGLRHRDRRGKTVPW